MKRLLLIGSLLILAACRQSPKAHQTESLKTIRSWTATAQMATQAWQQGFIPDVYAQQVLEKSQQEITQAARDLEHKPTLLLPLQQSLQQINEQIKQHHKDAIAIPLHQLSNQQLQLNTLVKAQETP